MACANGAEGGDLDDRLARIESRIELMHGDLRELASLAARLKLMADNAKRQDKARGDAIGAIGDRLDRIEDLLRSGNFQGARNRPETGA